jgi:gliding motility-associated lipoprotein GldH
MKNHRHYFQFFNVLKIAIFILILSATACKEESVTNTNRTIPSYGWAYRDSLEYKFEIKDTTTLYNLYLDINHTSAYPLQNLYTFIRTVYPNGKTYQQQLNMDLAAKSGQWNGEKEWFKDRYNLRIVLQEGSFFNQMGEYKLNLQQYLRQDSIPGLNTITLRIEDAHRKRGEKKKK